MPQPYLFSQMDKAVFDYNMIEKGDRILVGASGGKDSTALVEYFAKRALRKKDDFEFKAVHVHSEITGELDPRLAELFKSWNVECDSIYVDVIGRLKPGRKMNCYWCSTQRRTELIRYAMANGYNKLALGHHLDDLLETVLMNALDKGTLMGMPPRLQYEKYPLTIIRPLCYSDTKTIIEHGTQAGYISSTCTCNYQSNSTRKDARKKIDFLTDGDYNKKLHLLNSLRNINKDYLL